MSVSRPLAVAAFQAQRRQSWDLFSWPTQQLACLLLCLHLDKLCTFVLHVSICHYMVTLLPLYFLKGQMWAKTEQLHAAAVYCNRCKHFKGVVKLCVTRLIEQMWTTLRPPLVLPGWTLSPSIKSVDVENNQMLHAANMEAKILIEVRV